MSAKPLLLVLLGFAIISCSGSNSLSTVNSEGTNGSNLPAKLSKAFPNLAFSSSVFLSAVPGTSQLAVVEQAGRIKVFDNIENTADIKTVLDISDVVLFGGEQGLLGLAFDPQFDQNRFVYVNYSTVNPRRNVVSRMQWDLTTNEILAATEEVILEIEQPHSNHNGGMLAFGPDNYLYIGVGDGGSGGDPQRHGQNRSTILGNVLRIDVHAEQPGSAYAIPEDNPFANDACCRPEIFSYGWRNPYRFSFDRQTGELWVPDVGQNAIEEINIVSLGGNYGWNVFEGSQPFREDPDNPNNNYLAPVFEYDHSQGSSITGGYVYRGLSIPSLMGKYVYGDYVSGNVWALELDADGSVNNSLLGTVPNPTSFGETADGEIIIVSHNSGLFKIEEAETP